jgi:NAD(P)-dependent dehydrogenase (short-subunit alcohol dehydrogenase family)
MQSWLITGVGSGLGRALASQLLEAGHRVFGTVRNVEAVADLAVKHGDRFLSAVLDVSETARIPAVVNEAFAAFGRIDAVVNNAGYGLFGAAEALDTAQIRHQLDTNLVAPIEVARAALPHLRAQGGGQLIAISSYGGQATHPGASLYHASKWGLEGFFDSLAQEVAPFGIKVTIVEPGAARTGFRQAAAAQLGNGLEAYASTPLAHLRTILEDPARTPTGDPQRMAARIIESVTSKEAPLRLVLGSDALAILEKALEGRLDQVRSQASSAPATDASA